MRSGSGLRILFRLLLLVALIAALVVFGPMLLRRYGPNALGQPATSGSAEGDSDTLKSLLSMLERVQKLQRGDGDSGGETASDGKKKGPVTSTAIPPQDAALDSQSGEKIRRFQGFGLSVETRPSGAQLLVNEQDVGETPLVTSVECEPGDLVKVEVRKRGFISRARTTTCRQNQLVEMMVDLK
jgi:hypothetical protein